MIRSILFLLALSFSFSHANAQCSATISGDAEICYGGSAALEVTFTGSAPWQFVFAIDGIPQTAINAMLQPYSLLTSTAGVYTLVSVSDGVGCNGTVSGQATVSLISTPQITNFSETCNGPSTHYTVSFEITGGDPASYVVNGISGILTGNLFTSDLIPSATGYTIELDDGNACGPNTKSGIVDCNCVSQAGDMDQSTIEINGCLPVQVTAIYDPSNEVLDPDDVLLFVFTDNFQSIFETSTTPEFTIAPNDLIVSSNFFITAMVGNGDGNGGIDLNDPCLHMGMVTLVMLGSNLGPIVTCNSNTINCNNEPLQMDCTVVGGSPPYTFVWEGPGGFISNEQNPILPMTSGVFTLTVTDQAGCSTSISNSVVFSDPIECTIEAEGEISCLTSEVILSPVCTGGSAPFQYSWSDGSNSQNALVFAAGIYTLTITDANGCTAIGEIVVVENLDEDCGVIQGSIAHDIDGSCIWDGGDTPLEGWMVKATGSQNFYGMSDENGEYAFGALPGDYVVEIIPPANGYWAACDPFFNVTLVDPDDVQTINFAIEKIIDCPYLEVDISTSLLRRCFSNYYLVSYCNFGSSEATDAYVEVTLDPLLSITSSSIPYTATGDLYTFEIDDVGVGDCGEFHFITYLSCDAILGETLCAVAQIYPDTSCIPVDPLWSGASIEVTSECTQDEVKFTITNAGEEDMDEPVDYIVVEDGVMFMVPEQVSLLADETKTLNFPANGSTYILQVEQVAYHPGQSAPLVAVEGCGTNLNGLFSTGFMLQFPEDDLDPFLSIDCQEVIGSYDPNDKRGYPFGYGDEHLIDLGQRLDYHIRFQNTGTDTAFKVVSHDVLSAHLDMTTLRPGASSHPYQLEIIGSDTLAFIFDDILLPDSNINEALSHGFVKFSVEQSADAQLGDVIENQAAIYFDFNDAVLTNTTIHKIGEHEFPTATGETDRQLLFHKIVPNPTSAEATLSFSGNMPEGKITVQLFDITGQSKLSQELNSRGGKLHLHALPTGLYFYEIRMKNQQIGQGKLIIE